MNMSLSGVCVAGARNSRLLTAHSGRTVPLSRQISSLYYLPNLKSHKVDYTRPLILKINKLCLDIIFKTLEFKEVILDYYI
jgi:hypothetical protein